MRLTKIKLAGFKSFVDPTTMALRSNLTAIVGPNGCGKSNVVDAIRWVIGESSAKQLRGESLTDVIFNGTTQRRSVSKASVELVFDNQEGRLGGEYAKFAEISVRREIDLSAQSTFFLNGTRCRRKDIISVFLGTGLGPSSYAIIEQGTISQLIESKPEELRVYFEEAAGISKYKERRRETELRIGHTRDNLERLSDVREELTKQLGHLKRQANAAERYKEYQHAQQQAKAELLAMKWRKVDGEIAQQQHTIQCAEVALEAELAKRASIEAELEQRRQQQIRLRESCEVAQSKHYQISAELITVEQQIVHAEERQQQLTQNLTQQQQSVVQWQQQRESDDQQHAAVVNNLPLSEQQVAKHVLLGTEAEQALIATETAMADWQQRWDSYQTQATGVERQLAALQARLEQWQQQRATSKQRYERLFTELSNLPAVATDSITHEQALVVNAEQQQQCLQQQIEAIKQDIGDQRSRLAEGREQAEQLRSQIQKNREQRSSLAGLQEAALGGNEDEVRRWLAEQQLHDNPRLITGLSVTPGWETAVETVLGHFLQAVGVNDLAAIAAQATQLLSGNLVLISNEQQQLLPANESMLASKVSSNWPIAPLLQGIYVADTWAQALALSQQLAPDESVITRQGHWLSRYWLSMVGENSVAGSVIEREKALHELHALIEQHEQAFSTMQQQLIEQRSRLTSQEQQRDVLQEQYQNVLEQLSRAKSQLQAALTQQQQQQQRRLRLENEVTEHHNALQQLEEKIAQAEESLMASQTQVQQYQQQQADLHRERDQLRTRLQVEREQVNRLRQELSGYRSQLDKLQQQQYYLQQNRVRIEAQLQLSREQRAVIERNLHEVIQPLPDYRQRLAQLVELRLAAEAEVTSVRTALQKEEHLGRELAGQRTAAECLVNEMMEGLQTLKMEWQAQSVRRTTLQEQLQAMGLVVADVVSALPSVATLPEWEAQIAQLEQRIQRLGAINLAAIEEYSTLQERATYLEAQQADLVAALGTLEDAIRKIDKETRALFRETFDQVNAKFKELFPKIFGGGQGSLELTHEDLLHTGVMVMAQPPGKRNASIYLLSGGEKALTAIALLFSVFQLNPAPFCILDEVDAPLDDVNVSRYCTIVKEMAKAVQILFISHNKIAIEMAEQLAGVTMQEPGVSRLVSVDILEAITLIEEA